MRDPFLDVSRFAFRLELLPHYADDSTGLSADLEHFIKTGKVLDNHNKAWVDLVESVVSRGGRVMRLRAVSSPLSPYEEFELKIGYCAGISAGEQVRVVDRSLLEGAFDYWCFDGEMLEVIQYGNSGEHLGAKMRGVLPEDRDMLQRHIQLFSFGQKPIDYLRSLR